MIAIVIFRNYRYQHICLSRLRRTFHEKSLDYGLIYTSKAIVARCRATLRKNHWVFQSEHARIFPSLFSLHRIFMMAMVDVIRLWVFILVIACLNFRSRRKSRDIVQSRDVQTTVAR